MLAGAWINNPWTIAPMYMAGTLLGCALLGVPTRGSSPSSGASTGRAFYASLLEGLRPYLLPYIVGNLAPGRGARRRRLRWPCAPSSSAGAGRAAARRRSALPA